MPEFLDLQGKTTKAVRAAADAALRRHGLHLGQDHLLAALWEQDGRTPGEVAAATNVTTPAVTKVAARLAEAGLLTRQRDERDNRLVRFWLTAAGRALREPVEAERRLLDEKITKNLTATERRHLMSALAKICQSANDLLDGPAEPEPAGQAQNEHVLTTERLVLRPVTGQDHAALVAHWTAPEVRHYLFDAAIATPEEITQAIEDSTRNFAAAGYGLWLIQETGAAELAGTAGLRPLEDLGLEIIYSLAPDKWGRGYATEAARALLQYARGPLGLPHVLAEVDEGNSASVAVVERLGMTPFAVVPGLLGPMTRYRTSRPPGGVLGGLLFRQPGS